MGGPDVRPVVILADDDEAITSNLAPFLDRAGFTVHVAADGDAALALVERLDPDGCVLDVLMPGPDGREVLRRLRRAGRWLPVVLLTQVGESAERAIALDEGADDYLNKPFDPYELLARLRAVLRRARPGRRPLSASPTLRAGDLRLDRISRRAWLRDAELVLTPKAMLLLDYLLTHPDELMTRDRLLEVLWGFDFPVGTRAVDTGAGRHLAGHRLPGPAVRGGLPRPGRAGRRDRGHGGRDRRRAGPAAGHGGRRRGGCGGQRGGRAAGG